MYQINDTLRPIDGHKEQQLPLTAFTPPTAKELEGLRKHPSLASVYRWMLNDLSSRVGGVTDRQMASQLDDMDAGYFSRVMNGQAAFSHEKELRFMAICGRGDPVYWRLLQIGMDPAWLRPLESESERTIRELEERVERMQREQEILIKALRGEQTA